MLTLPTVAYSAKLAGKDLGNLKNWGEKAKTQTMKCPFCEHAIPEGAPCCPECGYKEPSNLPPSGKLELTDEQIMAFAGFQVAQRDLKSAHRLSEGPGGEQLQKKVKKIVMFVVMGFVVPALIGALYNRINHQQGGGLDMGSAAKMMRMSPGDSQSDQINADLAQDVKPQVHN